MESADCFGVAVHVRPLINTEVLSGCTDCVNFIPGEPQVQIGTHSFTFDHVYGSTASSSSSTTIYNECVAPLVQALFQGYNATVMAYGQTGSGKTYTMGSNYEIDGRNSGIIPQVMNDIFSKIEEKKESTEFIIRVSFIEILNEEVFDLLHPNSSISSRGDGALAKLAAPRKQLKIRETANGEITLGGVTELKVFKENQMASLLYKGSLARISGSTKMNNQSSRSHAIFTIIMEQKRSTCNPNGDIGDDILSAKLRLVDLAGSESVKKTGAVGSRLREGKRNNTGLLTLENVIRALEEKKTNPKTHVPYRESKLTRLLQDSLGGNCKKMMIVCVSPANSNMEQTLSTLNYASSARNILNKAIINRDPMTAMRSQIERYEYNLKILRQRNSVLEASNTELHSKLHECQILRQRNSVLEASNTELHSKLHECQVEKDKLKIQIELSKKRKSRAAEIDATDELMSSNDEAKQPDKEMENFSLQKRLKKDGAVARGESSSNVPSFKLELKNKSRRVDIHATFAKEHLSKAKRTNFTLTRDSSSMSWEVRVIYSNSGGQDRWQFIGGWPRFRKDMNLVVGDICVFQKVSANVMKVLVSN